MDQDSGISRLPTCGAPVLHQEISNLAEALRRLDPANAHYYRGTPGDVARSAAIARNRTGESLDFRPAGDRYPVNRETGQYLLDLPPVEEDPTLFPL